jgi:hypothetical protein
VYGFAPTTFPVLPSASYDLGTWNFDAEGDYEAAQAYIFRTSNGGLANLQQLLRGAFVGASLPALPLLGFAALAAGLVGIARCVLGPDTRRTRGCEIE